MLRTNFLGCPQANQNTLNNGTTKRSTIKDTRETKARRNEWRITKMVLAIFLSFLVCYLPITIAKVADMFHIAGYLLLYASACVNPIIYVIMNAQYRAAYAAALCCPLSRISGLTSEKWNERHGYSFSNTRTVLSQVSLDESRTEPRGTTIPRK
ncbi:unnamed protein product [Leptidea sinapis]|uniref:G-protein coupled receptors family 1 profile domain-containing protein n=1 Tax=Leptidea sinapis TaxID=189913 RepID=A0A5E4Q2A3_9NEOP|nr:unnamed protein product [Leptidea sinapis]